MRITPTRSLLAALIAAGLGLSQAGSPDGVVSAESLGQTPQVDEIAVALRSPGSHQRLGVPDFYWANGAGAMAEQARTVAEVLWADIDFEREFYMIPRAASAKIPVTTADALPYDAWSALGTDFVLAGTARAEGQSLVLELRLMYVRGEKRGTQYFGRRYQCGMQTARGPRDCAHQIADDFHKEVRQLDGVARTKIAFASDRDSGRVAGRPSAAATGKEIYISDYDGANQSRLTTNGALNISPAWSPNGGLLAYTSYTTGFPDIYVANLAQPGRGLQRPAQGTTAIHNQLASWSPDGSRMAFMSNRGGSRQDIWIVNADGSGLRNLTNTPNADEGSPTWSPDGQRIAFSSDRAGSPQLYVQGIASPTAQRLTSERIDRPTWSSLDFIAFTVGTGPFYDIGIYDFNMANPVVQVLTGDGAGTYESPSVSPNGRHIAFLTTRWGRQEIATMDRTGQNIRRVTQVGNNTYPNWQPIVKR
jgi:TolB protein